MIFLVKSSVQKTATREFISPIPSNWENLELYFGTKPNQKTKIKTLQNTKSKKEK
jgi:hypothetical protein